MVHDLGRRLFDEAQRHLAGKELKVTTDRQRDNHQCAGTCLQTHRVSRFKLPR
jgi:hypothetical protein